MQRKGGGKEERGGKGRKRGETVRNNEETERDRGENVGWGIKEKGLKRVEGGGGGREK